ncbi:hypothetical protein YTPLAS18_23570 [Nitrospira sp.]|nr:hypothetical protein YTPLAS18_23570 [Nitrospira sp.]
MAFIQKDLVSGSGDQLLTLDTDTNLEWLNLTATANRSVNEVLGGFGGFVTTHGFRYAIGADLGTLYAHAGITKGLSEPAFQPSPNDDRNHTGVEILQDLMNGKQFLPAPDSSTQSRIMTHGMNGGDPAWFVRYLSLNITRHANSHTEVNPLNSLDSKAPHIGSYLVRSAPSG